METTNKPVNSYSKDTIMFMKRDGRIYADALDVFNWMQVNGVDKGKKNNFLRKMNDVSKYFDKKEEEKITQMTYTMEPPKENTETWKSDPDAKIEKQKPWYKRWF